MSGRDIFFAVVFALTIVPPTWLIISDWFRERLRKKRQDQEIRQYLASFDYTEPKDALSAHISRLGGVSETFVKVMPYSHDGVHDELRRLAITSGRKWFETECQEALKQIVQVNGCVDKASKGGKQKVEVMRLLPRIQTDDRFGLKDRETRLRELIGGRFGLVYYYLLQQGFDPKIEYVEWQASSFVTSHFRIVVPVCAATSQKVA